MLVNNLELQSKGRRDKYALGAFNTNNLEITQAIIEAAIEKNSPVIIATSESAIKYAGLKEISKIVRSMGETAPVPVTLHLDHGKDLKIIEKCITNGWTSIMIDGSGYDYDKNVEVTQNVVEMCRPKGISVEAELGRLGGIEDNVSVDERDARLTDPKEAKRFVEDTGCDTLAIAIGTSHGAYKFKGESKLAFDRLKEINNLVKTPLVLHGASSVIPEIVEKATRYGAKFPGAKGVPVEDIKTAISLGITKINIDTDLRMAFTASIREFLSNNPDVFDPRKILGSSRAGMKQVVLDKIDILGSGGRA